MLVVVPLQVRVELLLRRADFDGALHFGCGDDNAYEAAGGEGAGFGDEIGCGPRGDLCSHDEVDRGGLNVAGVIWMVVEIVPLAFLRFGRNSRWRVGRQRNRR